MKNRVGQTWQGLRLFEPSQLLLVVRLLEESTQYHGHLRVYECVDLETGDKVHVSESDSLQWNTRDCSRVA